MGSLFGGGLASSGHDVVLYDVYKDHVDAINRDGLAIEDAATGAVKVVRPKASADPEAVRDSDVMIIFVKSTNTEEAAASFKTYAKPGTMLPCRTAGRQAILRKHFGPEAHRCWRDIPGCDFPGAGQIRHAGKGLPTWPWQTETKQARIGCGSRGGWFRDLCGQGRSGHDLEQASDQCRHQRHDRSFL